MAAGETLFDTGPVEGANATWSAEHLLGDDTPRTRAAAVAAQAPSFTDRGAWKRDRVYR